MSSHARGVGSPAILPQSVAIWEQCLAHKRARPQLSLHPSIKRLLFLHLETLFFPTRADLSLAIETVRKLLLVTMSREQSISEVK